MIRRMLLSFGLVTLLLIVQSTWLGFMAVQSVVPDLALLAVVYISFKSDSIEGQVVGFASGLLEDGMSAAPLGLNAFIKTAVAWSFNIMSGKFYIDRILMPVLFGLVATLAKAVYLFALSALFAKKILAYDFLSVSLWIEVGYNAVAAPVFFFVMRPLDRFLIPPEKRA